MSAAARSGVLLMTYGSPATLEREDIRTYLAAVRGGREPDAELVDEFTRRYQVIGGSPLIPITGRQAAALERRTGRPAEVGMRFSEPSIATGLERLTERGADEVVAIILSPQYSPLLMRGYEDALRRAVAGLGARAPRVRVADPWFLEPAFVAALADRIRAAIGRLPAADQPGVRVLLTAHSLPRTVADREPDYLAQLRDTAEAVARAAAIPAERWTFCWQSAGHEPGEWMKPDFADLMPDIGRSTTPAVVVAPIQFLADHLEVLYDVDVGAREQAEANAVRFERIASLNDDPGLIEALAALAGRRGGTAIESSAQASSMPGAASNASVAASARPS
ncbi:MAG TPA: ferrochelatase [Candidatus Limnocylindrales bacterium]|nr:ferrochelatase [Candidatus Limnocylindrales bacterium]